LGFGYRYTEDFTRGSFSAQLIPAHRGIQVYSAFLQDDIQLLANQLVLTLGSKLEHNDFSGFEAQPNIRLLWTPNPKSTLWASIARAVRIPSRGDQDFQAISGFYAANQANNPLRLLGAGALTPNLFLRPQGNASFDSESVIAYETGLKHQLTEALSFDLALFYNHYTRQRSTSFDKAPSCEPSGQSIPANPLCLATAQYAYLPISILNKGMIETYGLESVVEWRPNARWRLQGVYSFLQMQPHALKSGQNLAISRRNNPQQQFSLRTSWNPRPDLDADLWLRYVDRIGGNFGLNRISIPAYFQMDLRLAWRPLPKVELSLAGFNLLDRQHPEFFSELGDLPLVEIKRSFYGQIRWEF
jgi:iron complex outermembrane receptor protein